VSFSWWTLSDDVILQDYLEAIAKARFKNEFRYNWSSTNCSPPSLSKDGTVHPASDYCLIDQNHNLTPGIKSYVDQGLAWVFWTPLSGNNSLAMGAHRSAGLEIWMKSTCPDLWSEIDMMFFEGKAAADLAAAIGTYTSNLCDNNWYYEPFTQTYNASNDNVDSYQCDAVIVYTNATHSESVVEATLHILYFVGVRDLFNSSACYDPHQTRCITLLSLPSRRPLVIFITLHSLWLNSCPMSLPTSSNAKHDILF